MWRRWIVSAFLLLTLAVAVYVSYSYYTESTTVLACTGWYFAYESGDAYVVVDYPQTYGGKVILWHQITLRPSKVGADSAVGTVSGQIEEGVLADFFGLEGKLVPGDPFLMYNANGEPSWMVPLFHNGDRVGTVEISSDGDVASTRRGTSPVPSIDVVQASGILYEKTHVTPPEPVYVTFGATRSELEASL